MRFGGLASPPNRSSDFLAGDGGALRVAAAAASVHLDRLVEVSARRARGRGAVFVVRRVRATHPSAVLTDLAGPRRAAARRGATSASLTRRAARATRTAGRSRDAPRTRSTAPATRCGSSRAPAATRVRTTRAAASAPGPTAARRPGARRAARNRAAPASGRAPARPARATGARAAAARAAHLSATVSVAAVVGALRRPAAESQRDPPERPD
jgi:ribonuclease E